MIANASATTAGTAPAAPAPARLVVREVAVLGAGVMGAQIAAHLVNAGVRVCLFDLTAKDGDRNAIARKGVAGLAKLEPAPLGVPELAAAIEVANYDDDLPRLATCDLVIEAIAERLDWKRDLYARIGPFLAPDAIVASNTSGLSLAALDAAMPAALRNRFCGIHFFNPPRYMHLVELIAAPGTQAALLDALETFLTTTLGKGVIRARDTPNFIANRIGVFSIVATMLHTERYGLGFDVVDALTGPAIGRPKSASYRTVDVVGLDTTAHVIATMRDNLPDDPWHACFAEPRVLTALVAKGALGQKSGAGFYRKVGRDIEVLEPATGAYRASAPQAAPEVLAILGTQDPRQMLTALRASAHPQAQFLWAVFRDVFHYAAFHLAAIADNARDVDLALRWGFGWTAGPFETWQAAGFADIARAIRDDIAAGRTLAAAPLPDWIDAAPVVAARGVHTAQGSWSPQRAAFVGRSTLPVYRRQRFPDAVLGERHDAGTTIFETDALRMWHLGDDVGIVSFKTKQNTVSSEVLDGIGRALDVAEAQCAGLVLWQTREPFSFGANLASLAPAVQAGQWSVVEDVVHRFQQTSMRLRYSLVPTIAAVRGMALGGGCEFTLHCDRAVAAFESYIGLVEAGVGLLPAGGGTKEFAMRAADDVARGRAGGQQDPFPFVRTYFQNIATAKVSKSALDAKALGYLRPADVVVMHAGEVLHVALAQARALAEQGYRPPLPRARIAVTGRTGIGTLQMMLVNLRDGGFVSAYDFDIGLAIARVICGGEIDAGSEVDEKWLLDLERREFLALLHNAQTQARIAHTLATGKPLRN
ncbi:MAG TPA: 3-hydroxyacyl-CoA dehydrogenase/enoyl-CoA hydratase family protein [Casimicrobiaceae bacterium]|nr:3-hydroxyacyl-CoA dehydrogenase/enoyl-CoA hydratase family protein [Casimicrobiaceae bacterium]